ncbi:MAG: DAK2 domain-containing protein [Clostridia bacterium]|nr:DAK2 domain-containing protein [Clostridia bacterium]
MGIDGIVFASCVQSAANLLKLNEKQINELNVYPVPDGDTGSNMRGTIFDATLPAEVCPRNIGQCAKELSARMLKTARGNSGAILSQFFRGFAEALENTANADLPELALALSRGTDSAYKAVSAPVEGTALTVMRASAEKSKALAKNNGEDPAFFFDQICSAAEEALSKTTEMLPSLKEAGVVDAGGLGFLTVLRGFNAYLNGRELSVFTEYCGADFSSFKTESILYTFCVECNISKHEAFSGEDKCSELSASLSPLGDSLVFIETDTDVKLHIHTNSPQEIMRQSEKYGVIENKKIENMALQHTNLILNSVESVSAVKKEKEFGFVFVSSGEGFNGIFKDLGADKIVFGGQSMNPSTGDILSAITETPAENVFVFSGNPNIILTANQAAEIVKDQKIFVIPTKSLPQSVSAALSFDAEASSEENAAAMTEAAENIRSVSVTKAVKSAVVNGQNISAGEYIGLINGKLNAVGISVRDCLFAMKNELSEAEFINIYYGADVSLKTAKETAEVIDTLAPDAETELIFGGQPLYDYLISLE